MVRVTVFVSGAVLLAVEILGGRLLAPYFGNSIHVWGSVIGVFLAALSLGYAVGGRIADTRPSKRIMSGILFTGGALTLLIAVLAEPLLDSLAKSSLGPEAGALCAACALFLVPMTFIGMVTPFALRLQALSLESVGSAAGSLYAYGTVGSLAGTFGTSFFTIQHLGVRANIAYAGLALVVLAVLGWRAEKGRY